jgi:cellulose synthase-like protein
VVVLALFLYWRITHEITDAIWLWRMSIIVSEIWFAFSWLLYHFLESPSPDNPTGKSDLPGIDVSVSTADSEKEPPTVSSK